MPEAVIVDAIRTPIGRAVKGSLKTVRADDLASIPLAALIERNPGVDFAETVDVLMGAAFGEAEQGYNVARNASILAGLPFEVPGATTNRFCASSLQTIRNAFHAIKAGEGDQYIAAGVEAVSRTVQGGQWEFHPKLNGSEGSITNVYIPMGLTAENVAERYGVTREEQDEWAALSQQRAVAAQEAGHFDNRNRRRHRRRPHRRRQGRQPDRRARDRRRQGRRPARRHHRRRPREPPPGLQARRHRQPPATPARSTTAQPRPSS